MSKEPQKKKPAKHETRDTYIPCANKTNLEIAIGEAAQDASKKKAKVGKPSAKSAPDRPSRPSSSPRPSSSHMPSKLSEKEPHARKRTEGERSGATDTLDDEVREKKARRQTCASAK